MSANVKILKVLKDVKILNDLKTVKLLKVLKDVKILNWPGQKTTGSSATNGKTAMDVEPAGVAASEVKAMADEILGILNPFQEAIA